jgi:Trk-type K+ transport system membrane component
MNFIKNNLANAFTLGNLFSGSIGVINLVDGNYKVAAICIIISLVLDFLDGFVARALKANSNLGAQLDSLADMVSFGLGDFGTWGPLTTIIFIILLALGACSGSTSGGLKIFRVQVAFALFKKQMRQLMHPSGVFPQKYNGRPVNDAIIRSLISFVLVYFAIILMTLLNAGKMPVFPQFFPVTEFKIGETMRDIVV